MIYDDTMDGKEQPRLIRSADVMNILGISRPTLGRWVKKGIITPVIGIHMNSRVRYFRKDDIESLIQR